jgi:hypothetical protein
VLHKSELEAFETLEKNGSVIRNTTQLHKQLQAKQDLNAGGDGAPVTESVDMLNAEIARLKVDVANVKV